VALTADQLRDLLHKRRIDELGELVALRPTRRTRRPPLRIGQHGKISRRYLGNGVWEAQCRYRDTDGVTRRVRRAGPADQYDRRGKLAEDVLIEALAQRRPPSGGPDEIGLDTAVMTLVEAHLARLAEDGRAPATQATYRIVAGKLRIKLGGVAGRGSHTGADRRGSTVHEQHSRASDGPPG